MGQKHMSERNELKRAHRIRHEGIGLENAGRLAEAERKYEEALSIYREYSTCDDLDYANAARYVAAIKQRLGQFDEAKALWEEAARRYEAVGVEEGVAEARDRLADIEKARRSDGPPATE